MIALEGPPSLLIGWEMIGTTTAGIKLGQTPAPPSPGRRWFVSVMLNCRLPAGHDGRRLLGTTSQRWSCSVWLTGSTTTSVLLSTASLRPGLRASFCTVFLGRQCVSRPAAFQIRLAGCSLSVRSTQSHDPPVPTVWLGQPVPGDIFSTCFTKAIKGFTER